jgi:small subunit ribosomal protein S6
MAIKPNFYETLYVVRPDLKEEELTKIQTKLDDFVGAHEGEIMKSAKWAERELAYEILDHKRGVYYILVYKAFPTVTRDVEKHLRFYNTDVLRFMTVKITEEAAMKAKFSEAEKSKDAKTETPEKEAPKEEPAKAEAPPVTPPVEAAQPEALAQKEAPKEEPAKEEAPPETQPVEAAQPETPAQTEAPKEEPEKAEAPPVVEAAQPEAPAQTEAPQEETVPDTDAEEEGGKE